MTTDATATQTDATQQQATSDGGQNQAQLTMEERLKAIETEKAELTAKYEASVREMNEKQRLAAEREKEADMLRLQLQQTAVLAAQQNRASDPLAELDARIQQAEEQNDFSTARRLERERANFITQAVVTQNAQAQINSFSNMVDLNPVYTPETKAALKELLYKDGKPEYGLNPKMTSLLTQAAITGNLTEVLEMAENKAIGRKVKSGDYDKEFTQKQKEAQIKADAEIKRQQSITQSGPGPSISGNEDEIKKKQREWMDKVMKSKFPT